MEECVICGSFLEREELEPEKEQRLRKSNEHLEDKKLFKRSCPHCGYISYHYEPVE